MLKAGEGKNMCLHATVPSHRSTVPTFPPEYAPAEKVLWCWGKATNQRFGRRRTCI